MKTLSFLELKKRNKLSKSYTNYKYITTSILFLTVSKSGSYICIAVLRAPPFVIKTIKTLDNNYDLC